MNKNEKEKKIYKSPKTEVIKAKYEGLLCISGQWGLID